MMNPPPIPAETMIEAVQLSAVLNEAIFAFEMARTEPQDFKILAHALGILAGVACTHDADFEKILLEAVQFHKVNFVEQMKARGL